MLARQVTAQLVFAILARMADRSPTEPRIRRLDPELAPVTSSS
jgi:hypothetical protein